MPDGAVARVEGAVLLEGDHRPRGKQSETNDRLDIVSKSLCGTHTRGEYPLDIHTECILPEE